MNATAVKLITVDEMVEMFDRKHGARFVTIVSQTSPKLTAGAPNVKKVSRVNGCVWFNYAAAVNRQREREGIAETFTPAARKWGVRLSNSALVGHKGKFYLEVKVEKSLDHKYIDANTGAEVAEEQISPFYPKKSESRQGVAQEICLRDYNLDIIQSIVHEGVTYIIAKTGYIPVGK